ncbi:hypothetical protein TWF694_006765 [Orbilia ellipsospora]|uniref:Uncharacterized protein n=1 Tax=Orbilia ellipsospora TaxID=2528407 RepID=A0AAV9XLK7_9PEZI
MQRKGLKLLRVIGLSSRYLLRNPNVNFFFFFSLWRTSVPLKAQQLKESRFDRFIGMVVWFREPSVPTISKRASNWHFGSPQLGHASQEKTLLCDARASSSLIS